MKFVICVAAVLLSSVTGRTWHAKRETDPGPALTCYSGTCENVVAPVRRILQGPTFRYLIREGLDCSQQTLTIAGECQTSSADCRVRHQNPDLPSALITFCRYKTEIEDEASCWTSDNLPWALLSCADEDRSAFAECAEKRVSSLTECSETSGAIFREMLSGLLP
ncbi:uncharacterized protein LOC124138141 [Haliotis rufescens]|uniref:uncharacterized protein LOC124138141 n=1 Tax=Haliotis rufescens TaxID=6454 RepID=UPI00201F200A|nr:uncharacterized protein LOC124138141 [Haliotis rufescens]